MNIKDVLPGIMHIYIIDPRVKTSIKGVYQLPQDWGHTLWCFLTHSFISSHRNMDLTVIHPTLWHRLMQKNIELSTAILLKCTSQVHSRESRNVQLSQLDESPHQFLPIYLQAWPCISHFISISRFCAQGRIAACLHKFQYCYQQYPVLFSVVLLSNMFSGLNAQGPHKTASYSSNTTRYYLLSGQICSLRDMKHNQIAYSLPFNIILFKKRLSYKMHYFWRRAHVTFRDGFELHFQRLLLRLLKTMVYTYGTLLPPRLLVKSFTKITLFNPQDKPMEGL